MKQHPFDNGAIYADYRTSRSSDDSDIGRRHDFTEEDFQKLRKCCSEGYQTPMCKPVFNQPHFDAFNRQIEKVKESRTVSVNRIFRRTLNPNRLIVRAIAFCPIITWLRHYNLKSDLIADIVCGFTVAIFHVPQSLGYALIVGTPAIYGLYTAIYPMLMYAIFGTSRQNSIGAFAVVCVMTSGVVLKVKEEFPDVDVVLVVSTLAFFVGIFQFLMGCLHMGGLSVFLSDQFVSGFTAGVSVHIGSSQLGGIFGFGVTKFTGPFLLIQTYVDFFRHIGDTHLLTLAFAVSVMAVILAVKILIDPFLMRRFHMPLPIEMIVMICSIILSNKLDLSSHGFKTVSDIRSSLRAPSIPAMRMRLVKLLLEDAALIAVVSFAVAVSLAKIWAREKGYSISPNQEFFALGISNFFGSLFGCFPVGASVPRSSLQLLAGGRTQLVSIINSSLIVTFILAAGQHLDGLPSATLSAIIIVSLKKIFMQVRDFKNFWNFSIIDGHVWLVAFFATVLVDVVTGLVLGVVFSLLTLVYKIQRPKTFLLGGLPNSDYYVPIKLYAHAREVPGVKIFQFGGPLHFANAEFFRSELIRKCGDEYGISLNQFRPDIVKQVIETMSSRRVTTFIASCLPSVVDILKKAELCAVIPETHFYPSVHDAVMHTFDSRSSNARGHQHRHRHLASLRRVVSFHETFGPDSLSTATTAEIATPDALDINHANGLITGERGLNAQADGGAHERSQTQQACHEQSIDLDDEDDADENRRHNDSVTM